MVAITTIGSALASIKTVIDLSKSMINLRDLHAFQEKAIEFQAALLDAQSNIFAVNEERSALIEKVSQLEKEMAALKAWEAEKQRYKLNNLPPGCFVYTLKPEMAAGEPEHHICQTCYQRGKKSILHADAPYNGVYNLSCHECDSKLQVGNFSPSNARLTRDHW